MEKKIDISKLLKDCPQGMELDCTMFDNVTFGGISNGRTIVVTRRTVNHKLYLDKYGCPLEHFKGDLKCVIFPKGKTTWEGFVPPCTFKDGDVVTDGAGWIGITSGGEKNQFIPTYCIVKPDGEFEAYLDKKDKWAFYRLATEEEKERLFKVIKENGYKWNAETKTLEKLIEPKFKVGDRIRYAGENVAIKIIDIKNNQYHIECLCDKYNEYKNGIIPVSEQKHYILIPNFDITTLKPFDKVLIRDNKEQKWFISFFGHYNNELKRYKYCCINDSRYAQCIPYEPNKHLLDTTNDCDEFYKTWEE